MDTEVELFDKVDEHDNVIGVTFKKEAHSQGFIHRAAAIFIFDTEGRLYLQVHEQGGGIFDHTVGGHIRAEESYEDGAKREMSEEIDLAVPLKKIGVIYSDETYTGMQYRHMFGVFTATAPSNWTFKPNEEVKKLVLLSFADVLKKMSESPRDFTAGFLRCMQFYCQEMGHEFLLDLNEYKRDRLKAA